MSDFKVIRITKTSEAESSAAFDYNTLDEANTNMHNYFGIEVAKEASIGVLCLLINNVTGQTDKLQWGETVKDRVYAHNDYMEDKTYVYDDEKTSIANYHTRIAAQRLNANCNFEITIRFDGLGIVKDFDQWTRPVPENAGE